MSISELVVNGMLEYYEDGVRVFHSRLEMKKNIPFKLYKITESYPSMGDHKHDYVQIWYVKKGVVVHTIHEEKYKMVAGNLYVIPPFVVHGFSMDPEHETEIIGCEFLPHFINGQFNESFEYLFLDEDRLHSKVTFSGETDLQVQQLLESMLQEYDTQGPNFELIIKGSLLILLGLTIREWQLAPLAQLDGKMRRHKEIMESVIEYIHNHYKEDIKLENICRYALMSRTYFCDLFKQYTGKTFQEYLIDLRLRKSMELLLSSDRTITDICFHVGFKHLTHFSRMFKKYTGVTPLYYKKHAKCHLFRGEHA